MTLLASIARFVAVSAACVVLAVLPSSPWHERRADELRIAPPFGNHMVLQRDTNAPIFGSASPGTTVTVSASWLTDALEARADDAGRWEVRVPTADAGGPYELRVSSDASEDALLITDVMVGEVWICSGQSNMEWAVRKSARADELPIADHPRMRLFNVANQTGREPLTTCDGAWSVCTPETAAAFSGVGFFFGRELLRELGDVPIGLIATNWGGTTAEAWTSQQTLRAGFPEFDAALDRIELSLAETNAEPSLEERIAAWWATLARVEPGMASGWMDASFAAEDWSVATLPGTWAELDLVEFDGCLWYRRDVDLPTEWRGEDLVLELGPIDDMDLTWFNGELVGATQRMGQWSTGRRYTVPAGAVRETNTIVVCAVDTGGVGSMGDDAMRLRRASDDDGPGLSLVGEWSVRTGSALTELDAFPSDDWFHRNSPAALYNGMLAPLVPYAIRGVIWYQGESNVARAAQYRRLFPALIEDWRARFARGAFPFYFVQIAPYAYDGDGGQAAELREAQLMTLATRNTAMAVTMDIGDPADIHPTNKLEVGRRLALCALAKTYGRDVECSGPLLRAMQVEGSAIRVGFDHGRGLTSGDAAPTCFTIAGHDRVFHPARATIDDETVIVRSDEVTTPVAVRFAWGAADVPNLRNAAGLPASSFRTDDWPPVSAAR